MARIYAGKKVWLHPILGWVENGIYRLCDIDPKEEMHWFRYYVTVVMLGMVGFVFLYLILLFQDHLPLNPNQYVGFSPDLAFNTAMSFVTHTSWQGYSGETQLSILSQMLGVVVQNFMSAAAGMAVAVALFRGFKRKNMHTIGNAWADMIRTIIYVLLPLSFVFALFLVSQGVVQNFTGQILYQPLQVHAELNEHAIAHGPVASQLSAKLLSSNGGGYFNVNSAHPYANPTPLTNMLSATAMLLLPVAFIYCFGIMAGDRRQGWSLLTAMTIIFLPLAFAAMSIEQGPNPKFDPAVIDQSAGNMEGKEMRIGAMDSALWGVVATATSSGTVNSMHDSYMPLSGMIMLMLIQFGEVIYGGVGNGAVEMIVYVLITVFLGGLMVGRTPEYLGKKLGPYEMKMAGLVMIMPSALVLFGTALTIMLQLGHLTAHNPGAQGFTEILYAFSSTSRNNGSAFSGLDTNTPYYNIALGICMAIGKFWVFAPVLAIAGSLAAKQSLPVSSGTLPTHTPLFTLMLVGVVILMDVLTYVPSLALGPIAEHLTLYASEVVLP